MVTESSNKISNYLETKKTISKVHVWQTKNLETTLFLNTSNEHKAH